MKRFVSFLFLAWWVNAAAMALHKQWTAADGLPTGEVHQIVALPNGQMLVNCEGVFCIATGAGFDVVPCEAGKSYPLPQYANAYCHRWQGDSLLWLRDFYRLYLFDVRRKAFRYDLEGRGADAALRYFASNGCQIPNPTPQQRQCIDSMGLGRNYTCVANDWQGGMWIGTRTDGIVYVPPKKVLARILPSQDGLIGIARSTTDSAGRLWRCRADGVECEEKGITAHYDKSNVKGLPYNRITFIQQLPDGRYLLCDSLSTLGYFEPRKRLFTALNNKLPALKTYRHFVGACPIDQRWTVVYAQNGIFMLDTKADTLASFIPAALIGHFATKYNCMARGSDGILWVGTQNGLFAVDKTKVTRIRGLRNNCIRSLLLDSKGRVWAGTSLGIARITPSVVNLGEEDGVPMTAMMERAACTTANGQLVFAANATMAVAFHPDSIIGDTAHSTVAITSCKVNGMDAGCPYEGLRLPYDKNYLSFRFSILDYATPSHRHYRYRLLPLEKEWNDGEGETGQGSAAYTALQAGDYRFEVQASDNEGGWGETTAIDICILPPLWATWWAKALYALGAIALLVLGVGMYLKKRRMQMERNNEERVNQLFELRDEARHQFAQSVNIEPAKIAANKAEEALVEKMLKAIGQNMDCLDYTVDQLASDIGMSRANLYKKTQQMLGITPNEFLRNVRLKQAATLLSETNEPVNQISLMVGFQTPRYFSQCFRQMFGVTPSEYRSGKRQ